MKINIHTVLDIAEKEIETAVPAGLRALLTEIENALGTEVTHVKSILTTDSGPREVAPTPVPELSVVEPIAPALVEGPTEETEAPPTPPVTET